MGNEHARETGNEKWEQRREFIFIFLFPVTSVYSYSTCMYVYMFEKDCKLIGLCPLILEM